MLLLDIAQCSAEFLTLAFSLSDSSRQPPRKRKAHFSDKMHDPLTPAYPISYRIPLSARH